MRRSLGPLRPSISRAVFTAFLLATLPPSDCAALTAEDYEIARIQGWTVHIEKSLVDHPRRAAGLGLLGRKLALVRRAVPKSALPKLRQVPIWVSREVSDGAAYHPSADWLAANGRVVEMERSIEIQNFDHFIDWSKEQPWLMLHELAHAWHHRFLPGGYNHPRILNAYRRATKGGAYRRVLYHDGSRRKAYALTNPMEYFAELSEAYFGRNDFQPFNRKQLKAFDPVGYRMVEKAWRVPKRRGADRRG